jgi:hypothetical protein
MNQFKSFLILALTTVGSAILILLVTGIASFAQAKEINLECDYIGVDGNQMSQTVMINTDLKQMSIGDDTGMLIATDSYYSTKINNLIGKEVAVNRSDLSWKLHIGMTGRDMQTTGCKVVEKKNQI